MDPGIIQQKSETFQHDKKIPHLSIIISLALEQQDSRTIDDQSLWISPEEQEDLSQIYLYRWFLGQLYYQEAEPALWEPGIKT